ncbi:MAG: hypothetical protein MRZ54_03580 [Clostridiales bacterium]|nr:hypothetical protein [Clostridiales bacterium]
MIRKMMRALCLVVALVLALPLAAMADTQHTLKIIPGAELASEEIVKDVLDAISLKLTTGDSKSGALTLAVKDTDVATLALAADETGLYAQCNLVSDDVFYVTWEDGFAFLTDMMEASIRKNASANGVEVDEQAIAALEEVMEQYRKQMTAAITMMGGTKGGMAVKTAEEAIAITNEMFNDDPEMAAYVKSVYDKMTVEKGDFADESRDAADEKYTMTMTGEDFVAICNTAYMRNIVRTIVRQQESDLEDEALEAEVDQFLEEIRKVYKENDINVLMTVYSANEGQDVVGMEMGMNMCVTEKDEEEPETVKIAMNMNYDRLTKENGVTHIADLSMEANDRSMMQMTFDLLKGKDGTSDGMLAALSDGTQITFLYHGENKGDQRMRSLGIYGRNGATAITEPAAAERPVITFQLASGETETDLLNDIEKATPATAVKALELSGDEIQALAVDVQIRAMQAFFTALEQMPASVQQMFIRRK